MFTLPKLPKVDKTALFRSFSTFNTLPDIDTISTDELINKTGKSRNDILLACLADDEVDACREDLESAIIAKPWRIYDDVAKGQAGVDAQTINRFYDVVRKHIKTFACLAVLTRFNGYAVAEYVYKQDKDGFLVIDKVLDKDGELDRFIPKRDGTTVYRGDTGDVVLEQTSKCLVLTSRAVPARPMGEMMIVKAYPSVLMRTKSISYAGQFIARYAQPYVIGKQAGFNPLQDFARTLYGFVSGGAVGIGADDDISLHQLSGDGSAFEKMERLANARIQKLLLGRVKTSELANGSRSAQETDDKTRQDRIGSYLALMTQAIQHAIDAMLLVNSLYGKAVNAPSGLWFEYVEQSAVDIQRATRDKIYTDTGQIALTREYMIDMVGYEAHHFTLTKPHNTPAQGKEMGLSLQLSDSPNHSDHSHDDEPLTATQAKISQRKVNKVLSLFDDIDDFNDFQKRLESLDLGDDEFVDELAGQNLGAYVDGLTGKANKDGQLGV